MLPQRQTTSSWSVDHDVADVARGALGAAVDPAVRHDPAADAGADLDVEQVLDVAPVGPVLAQGHDVDVVVDEDRRAGVALGEPVGDREAVPAGHDRRVDRLPAAKATGPGMPTPIRARRRRAPALAEQLRGSGRGRAEDRSGPSRDVDVERQLGERPAGQVGDGESRVGRAQVGGEDDARLVVEGEHASAAAAGGLGVARLVDEARGAAARRRAGRRWSARGRCRRRGRRA